MVAFDVAQNEQPVFPQDPCWQAHPAPCLWPGAQVHALALLVQGGDLYSALRNHPDTMRWERLGRKVALDVALGINYLHTRF